VVIPHSVVDDLLAADHHKSELAYTVYLLNPAPAARRYLYSGPASEEGGTQEGCPAPLWVAR
jgi:hypothetical protein